METSRQASAVTNDAGFNPHNAKQKVCWYQIHSFMHCHPPGGSFSIPICSVQAGKTSSKPADAAGADKGAVKCALLDCKRLAFGADAAHMLIGLRLLAQQQLRMSYTLFPR
jgi:hypothetical protein